MQMYSFILFLVLSSHLFDLFDRNDLSMNSIIESDIIHVLPA